jgi:hypothetical protein
MPEPITLESLNGVQGEAFHALLPEDIRAKPYVKDVNSFGDLVKKLDGAQTLLGQRVLPDENSSDEQWTEFYTKFRPETADKYEMPKELEGIPAEKLQALQENKVLRQIMHAAHISRFQAKLLVPQILKVLFASDAAETKRRDDAFAKVSSDLFGDQKDTIVANGKKFLAAHLPESLRGQLDLLDDKSLALVLAATDGMAKKITNEDPYRGGGGDGGGGSGENKDQIVAKMQTIMKDPAWGDPFKDQNKHKQLQSEMEVLRGKLRVLTSGK